MNTSDAAAESVTDRARESSVAPAVAILSPAEARFDRRRRTVGLFLGPLAFVLMWVLPLTGLSIAAHRLAAIVALVVVWWITEALPFAATALIGSALASVCGVASAQDAFAPYASPTIFLFIGSFLIARAASHHGLDRRLALALLGGRWARGSLSRVRLAIGALTLVASAWMSNAATVAMMFPMAMGIATSVLGDHGARGRAYAAGFLLTIAYGAGIGGMMTPVGSPPNLITIGLLDRIARIHIDFLAWMLVMVPIALAHAAVLFAAGGWLFPAPVHQAGGVAALSIPPGDRARAAWTAGQRNCLIAFALAVTLWLLPGMVALVSGSDSPLARLLSARLNEAVGAVLAAGLLFVLPTDWAARKFTLDWSQASRIDWGTILLFGGGLSLGQLMFATGLAEYVGTGLLQTTGVTSLWSVTAMAILIGMALTEFTSNTASTNMLVPIVLTMCMAGGLNPVPPALGAMLGVSSSYMLPISAPHVAIVYGGGLLPITAMIRFGLLMKLAAFVIILGGLRILCPLVGMA